MKDKHHIVIADNTYDALCDIVKYRETMNDVILELLLTYSKVHHVDTENIRRALNGRKAEK